MEEVLRAHRDQAFKLLKENRAQSRDGIELLVKARLAQIAAAAQPGTTDQMDALYEELLDLSGVMFSLGYTMAHTMTGDPVKKA